MKNVCYIPIYPINTLKKKETYHWYDRLYERELSIEMNMFLRKILLNEC